MDGDNLILASYLDGAEQITRDGDKIKFLNAGVPILVHLGPKSRTQPRIASVGIVPLGADKPREDGYILVILHQQNQARLEAIA